MPALIGFTEPAVPAPAAARFAPSTRGLIDAGQVGRRLHAIPSGIHAINQQLRTYGNNTLARARYLAINNSYAQNARESFIDASIGTGIVPSPRTPDLPLRAELRRVWDEWTDYADADGLTDFYGLQAVIAGEVFEAGEVFVRFRNRRPMDGFPVPLQLQVLPAEMLPFELNRDLGSGRRIECGIQFNAIGQREGYWFWDQHPGNDIIANLKTQVFVPASQILHIYKPRLAGQVRGLTHTVSSITSLAMLDLYDDAELERKRNAALFGAFITREPDGADDDDHPFADTSPPLPQNPELPGPLPANVDLPPPYNAQAWGKVPPGMATLEPGAMIDLEAGEDVTFSSPVDVGNSYDPFQYRNLTRITAGMGVPYAEATGDLKGANYSSLRAGRVAYKRRIERHQFGMFVYQLCRPVRLRWLQAAVLAAAVPLTPKQYLTRKSEVDLTRWRTPPWESHDPSKDATANQTAVGMRIKAISTLIEEAGEEPEEVFDQIELDQEALAERNIPPPSTGAPAAAAAPPDTGAGGGNNDPGAGGDNPGAG